MATEFGRISSIIDNIYGAALDESMWARVLFDINAYLNGTGAALFFVHGEDCKKATYTSGLDTKLFEDYAAYYFDTDPKVKVAFCERVNKITMDYDVIEESKMDSCEFYADCLAKYDLRYCLATAMTVDKGLYAVVTSIRGKRQGSQGKVEQRRLDLLVPHLRRALQLRARRLMGEAHKSGFLDALSVLVQGVVLVGRDGLIVWANPAAEAFLREQDGLCARRQRLCAGDVPGSNELWRLIASAAGAAADPLAAPGGVLSIDRPSMRHPYQLLVTPLPGASRFAELLPGATDLPVAAVFITDPERQSAPRTEHLAKLHGLTLAEAKLAAAVADGMSLSDYADQNQLSLNYVRWLLKQAESKTETRSQTELTRLLTRQIAQPPDPAPNPCHVAGALQNGRATASLTTPLSRRG